MNRGRAAILRRWARHGTLHPASSSSSSISSSWEARIGHLLQSPFLCHQLRGVKILGADVRQGVIIERKGRMVEVLKTQHTQQGRGGATIQVELRDLQSGLKSSERFRTTEPLEKVLVEVKTLTFLYLDGDMAVLMEPKTFEQVEIPKSLFGNGAAFLSDGLSVTLHYGDGKPISAAVPPKVTCKVAEAEPSYKGQTATAVYKKVLLDNGVRIMAPTFIKDGDELIQWDQRNLNHELELREAKMQDESHFLIEIASTITARKQTTDSLISTGLDTLSPLQA